MNLTQASMRTLCKAMFMLMLMLMSVLLPLKSFANETLGEKSDVPDPITFEETLPTGPGELEFWLNATYETKGDVRLLQVPQFAMFFGLVKDLSAEISAPYLFRTSDARSTNGIGDIEVSLKYLLLDSSNPFGPVSVRPGVTFGTANEEKGLGEGGTEYELFFSAIRDYGQFGLIAEVGYSLEHLSEDVAGSPDRHAASLNMEGTYRFTEKYSGHFVTQFQRAFTEDETLVKVGPGFKAQLSPLLSLGIASGASFHGEGTGFWSVLQTNWTLDF